MHVKSPHYNEVNFIYIASIFIYFVIILSQKVYRLQLQNALKYYIIMH
jgi:hypothetical protein